MRRGANGHDIFVRPNSDILSDEVKALVNCYSRSPEFGGDMSTPIETAKPADACHLLLHFIQSLPEPILDATLFLFLFEVCARPSLYAYRAAERNRPTPTEEHHRIKAAKVVLRLLPEPQFNALIHLLSLFALLPLYGYPLEKIVKIFGSALCSPRDGLSYLCAIGKISEDSITDQNRFEIEHRAQERVGHMAMEITLWLLTYWNEIANGLTNTSIGVDLARFEAAFPAKNVAENAAESTKKEQQQQVEPTSFLKELPLPVLYRRKRY